MGKYPTMVAILAAIGSFGNCTSSSTTSAPGTNSSSTTSAYSCKAAAVAADTLSMICVPGNTAGFSMGYAGVQTPVHTVPSITSFAMVKTEVQYVDWQTIKSWATSNGYSFANAGVQGDNGARTNQHPVTTINWRDAIVWCNAASQYDGFTPVYYTNPGMTTPVKTATNTASINVEDSPFVKWSANGYRLPTDVEWEYAARYIDGTIYIRGDAPSGWQDNNTANGTVDAAEVNAVAWYSANAGAATHAVGTASANPLGIFDMAGNVREWIWDWFGSYTAGAPYTDADSKGAATGTIRLTRGGSFNYAASVAYSSERIISGSPWGTNNDAGFRPVRRP